MQLRFIGCGDAFGSGGRTNTCFHVTGDRVNFLIDCGASSLPALKRLGIARDDIDLVLITHFHGDHFGGLPFLLLDAQFSRRTRPLVIAGPEGIEARLCQVMEALFENSSSTKQRFDLRVVALAPEVTGSSARSMSRRFRSCMASPAALPRLSDRGRGPRHRLYRRHRMDRDADPARPRRRPVDRGSLHYDRMVKNHLSLKTLEAHLAEIRPKRLVLTHMSDDMLERLDTLDYETASDGMVVEI